MNIELFIDLRFKATHSLEEVEKPHYHVWNVRVGVRGPLVNGRIASLPNLRRAFEEVLAPLQESFLNESLHLDQATRKDPTCENLCICLSGLMQRKLAGDLLPSTPGLSLSSIEVAVLEMNGAETGFARLTLGG